MSDTTDCYAELGVSRNATAEEITSKYRIRTHMYHPDKYQGYDEPLRSQLVAEAASEFRKFKVAYDILTDPKRRAELDRQLSGVLRDPLPRAPVDTSRHPTNPPPSRARPEAQSVDQPAPPGRRHSDEALGPWRIRDVAVLLGFAILWSAVLTIGIEAQITGDSWLWWLVPSFSLIGPYLIRRPGASMISIVSLSMALPLARLLAFGDAFSMSGSAVAEAALQGGAVEAVFAAGRYRRWGVGTMVLASIASRVGSASSAALFYEHFDFLGYLASYGTWAGALWAGAYAKFVGNVLTAVVLPRDFERAQDTSSGLPARAFWSNFWTSFWINFWISFGRTQSQSRRR